MRLQPLKYRISLCRKFNSLHFRTWRPLNQIYSLLKLRLLLQWSHPNVHLSEIRMSLFRGLIMIREIGKIKVEETKNLKGIHKNNQREMRSQKDQSIRLKSHKNKGKSKNSIFPQNQSPKKKNRSYLLQYWWKMNQFQVSKMVISKQVLMATVNNRPQPSKIQILYQLTPKRYQYLH